jgi:hypothetical protein
MLFSRVERVQTLPHLPVWLLGASLSTFTDLKKVRAICQQPGAQEYVDYLCANKTEVEAVAGRSMRFDVLYRRL